MEGLKIAPCLPPSWKTCSIKKVFRGVTYNITYENNGVNLKAIYVNGKKIEGNILPLSENCAEVKVITE